MSALSHDCCSPADDRGGASGPPALAGGSRGGAEAPRGTVSDPGLGLSAHGIEQASIPAQRVALGDSSGDSDPADGETPVHHVTLSAFDIDTTCVANADFARFVEATGYETEAETFGYSAVFHLLVDSDPALVVGPAGGSPWWYGVRGADWRHPGGDRTSIDVLPDHPVVHVSWNDATAYCAWAGRALPTEAQWECASRGGLTGARFPWGDDLRGTGQEFRANIWQGRFPTDNSLDDGFLGTAPVRTFQPNGYGLWQTVGNVWEWCADHFSADAYAERASAERASGGSTADPAGPPTGALRSLRGGSYLCHDSYCNRYRNSARSSNTPDSSMGNAGFRTVSLPA